MILPLCIAAIAIAESIIADRCLSYINFKEKDFVLRYGDNIFAIKTKELIDKCKKHSKNHSISITRRRDGETFHTDDLFTETAEWLKKRNIIMHSFAKSKPQTPTISISDYVNEAGSPFF